MDSNWLHNILHEININSADFELSSQQQPFNLGPKLSNPRQLDDRKLWFHDNTLYKNILSNFKFEQSFEIDMFVDDKLDKQDHNNINKQSTMQTQQIILPNHTNFKCNMKLLETKYHSDKNNKSTKDEFEEGPLISLKHVDQIGSSITNGKQFISQAMFQRNLVIYSPLIYLKQ